MLRFVTMAARRAPPTGVDDTASWRPQPGQRTSLLFDVFVLGHRTRALVNRHADPLPAPAVLGGHFLHRGDRGRGRDLPRDHARDRPASTACAPARKPRLRCQLSLRAHRRGGRRLCRDRHRRVCVRTKPFRARRRLSCSHSWHRLRSRSRRMYRGMHHPIDVMSGALIGAGCLCVGLLVAQVVGAVHERHRETATP